MRRTMVVVMGTAMEMVMEIKRVSFTALWITGLVLCVLAFTVWWFWDTPLISPLTSLPTFSFLNAKTNAEGKKRTVYGYMPYWNAKKTTLQPELTHLAYFGLEIGADGSLLTKTDEGGEPGYAMLQKEETVEFLAEAKKSGTEVEIVLTQFEGDSIAALLNSSAAHKKLLTALDSLILAYPITGIHIDIEYSGEVTPGMRQGMTNLMKTLHDHLSQKYQGMTLSIAMYAGAADSYQIWDVKNIEPYVDHVVVMAYDFHRRSSPKAGPVAPLFGGKELWDSDINQHLQAFLKVVPPEKILLGVPFYGYEWQTTSQKAQALTFPETGATASFDRVQKILAQKDELKATEHWNEAALSPYITYTEAGKQYVLYYENSRSISYKLDYVNQLELGGIAIWALGYEGNNRELWDVINTKI
jgi:spore germination protein